MWSRSVPQWPAMMIVREFVVIVFAVVTMGQPRAGDECQVTPVIHVLQYPGCVPKPIPSFACIGRCASYLQVSGSKIWQMERSCMCCQESGEREAAVSLFCPKAKPGERKFRKVNTSPSTLKHLPPRKRKISTEKMSKLENFSSQISTVNTQNFDSVCTFFSLFFRTD